MAADILLYQAHAVPVGDDQRQHLEFTRDLAQRFNSLYGETFTIPEAMIPREGARIMGLDNPTAKMSKSESSEHHAVYLLDDPAKVKKTVMRATTDSFSEIRFSDESERAGIQNLLTIYQTLTNASRDAIEREFEGRGYGDLKKAVVNQINDLLSPLQNRYNEIMREPDYLDEILAQGADKASEVAETTLDKAQDKIGLLRRRR